MKEMSACRGRHHQNFLMIAHRVLEILRRRRPIFRRQRVLQLLQQRRPPRCWKGEQCRLGLLLSATTILALHHLTSFRNDGREERLASLNRIHQERAQHREGGPHGGVEGCAGDDEVREDGGDVGQDGEVEACVASLRGRGDWWERDGGREDGVAKRNLETGRRTQPARMARYESGRGGEESSRGPLLLLRCHNASQRIASHPGGPRRAQEKGQGGAGPGSP